MSKKISNPTKETRQVSGEGGFLLESFAERTVTDLEFLNFTLDPELVVVDIADGVLDSPEEIQTALDSKANKQAAVATVDLLVAQAVYTQADIQLMVDLINELKATVNALSA